MQRKIYTYVNFIVIILAAVLFAFTFNSGLSSFSGCHIKPIIAVILISVFINFIKMIRLYLIIYGKGMGFADHIKEYSKSVAVSCILPLKLGEIFRMYCYGYKLGDMLSGIVYVIVDRFYDTLGLVAVMVITAFVFGLKTSVIAYLLLMFLILVIVMYFVYPGLSKYWKHFLLSSMASKRKLYMLSLIEHINGVYKKSKEVINGRGVILFVISVISWIVESTGIILFSADVEKINLMDMTENVSEKINSYLNGTLMIEQSDYAARYVFVSVIVMIVVYFLYKLFGVKKVFLKK